MSQGTPPVAERTSQRSDLLLRRLVRKDAWEGLKKFVARTRPEDLAHAMEAMTWAEQRKLYHRLEDPNYAAEVLSFLSDESSREVTRELTEEQVVDLLDRMEPDDATDVVAILPLDRREKILLELRDEETGEVVRNLLEWPADTAGGIMSPEAFLMPLQATCEQAIRALQEHHAEIESVYYIYIVDAERRIQGVVSLRRLLLHSPNTPLARFMTREIITVFPETDQEEVAQFVARYDLLAIPVVDEQRRFQGVVTVDDIVDVIRQEAAEDMMLMAGVSEDGSRSVVRQAWTRAGWLLATIFGGVLAAEIIGMYEDTLKSVAVLAGFIPVIMGMGGNVGIQSATIAVRGLALGTLQLNSPVTFVMREARVGILLGLFYAVLIGLYGLVRFPGDPMIGLAVASSILLAIATAAVIGAAIPVGLHRSGVDPAIATGPFVTTLVDLLGIVIYFNVAQTLLAL